MRGAAPVLVLTVVLASPGAGSAADRVELVLDGSGSMWGRVGDATKIEVARQVLKDLLGRSALPAESRIGLTAYGHRRKGDCADIERLASAPHSDRLSLYEAIDSISPKGKTPIAGSLRLVGESLRGGEDRTSVILVSDGLESCGEDPCAVARELRERYGIEVTIHVVGFDAAEAEEQLACIAEAGGGRYFSASNAEELAAAFVEVEDEIAESAPDAEPEPAPTDVAAATSGGQVLIWSSHYSDFHPENLIDGSDAYWMSAGAAPQSIVFGFADSRRARIADLLINPQNTQGTPRWAESVLLYAS